MARIKYLIQDLKADVYIDFLRNRNKEKEQGSLRLVPFSNRIKKNQNNTNGYP